MWIGEPRLLEIDGEEVLARDFAKTEGGKPAAVVREGAVDCPRCGASDGNWCRTPAGGNAMQPHAERVFAMNREVDRLRTLGTA